jgi:micrococcal nuclease
MGWPLARPQHVIPSGIAHRAGWALLVFLIVYGGSACGSGAPATASSTTRAISTSTSPPPPTRPSVSGTSPELVDATVVRVVDGDTIIVALGGRQQRVRLIGINSPELNKPDGPIECYATEATMQTAALIDRASDHVQLERDTSETDQYGRLLRYVWLLNPDGKQMLNEALVEGGFARAIAYRPDVKYQSILNREQSAAIDQNLGLWKACR